MEESSTRILKNLWQTFASISNILFKNLMTCFWENFRQASKRISDQLLGRVSIYRIQESLTNPWNDKHPWRLTRFWNNLCQASKGSSNKLQNEVLTSFWENMWQTFQSFGRISDKLLENYLSFYGTTSDTLSEESLTSCWKNLWHSFEVISNKISE